MRSAVGQAGQAYNQAADTSAKLGNEGIGAPGVFRAVPGIDVEALKVTTGQAIIMKFPHFLK